MIDKIWIALFWMLCAGNFLQHWAERLGWWGNINEPHISHVSIGLIWMFLALIWHRTSNSEVSDD